MPPGLTTRTTELEGSRVRVDVEVGQDAVELEVDRAAKALARELKIPGFRKGKVPPQVVLQRVGREAVMDDAVRGSLARWYEEAILRSGVAPVGEPNVDVGDMPDRGEPLSFSIEVAVRPPARLGDYRNLEVGRRDPQVEAADVDAEVERLRESVASLVTVERGAAMGDFAVIDFAGRIDSELFEGSEARGFVLELGSGSLVEGFEEQLVGATAGEERELSVSFPEDYRAAGLAGRDAVFAVSIKEVKEKRLPELDDDLAAEAGGFDTLAELREDIESKLVESQREAIEGEFREAAVDAAVAASEVDVPGALVHAKAHEMWSRTARQLGSNGIEPARYLELVGKTEEELVHEAEPEAVRALKRESVLAAVVEAEGIEVGDEELMETLRRAAAQPGRPEPSEDELAQSLERARSTGRDELLREDVAMRRAVDLLVDSATAISVEQAKARDKLWTPEKGERETVERAGTEAAGDAGGRPPGLWTPGS